MDTNVAAVIILGMHRSGTSSLAGSLQEYGLFLGKVHENNPHNRKGNRENPDIMQLNEALFEYNQGNWETPPISTRWTNAHERRRQDIIDSFMNSRQTIWGFKDPRSLFTLEFWLDGLKDNVSVKFVGSFRHPIAVALSLLKRNQIPFSNGIDIWDIYNTRLLELQQRTDFHLVCFDLPPSEYRDSIQRIASKLQLPLQASTKTGFFDETLRHHTDNHDTITLPAHTMKLYKKLLEIFKEQSL